MTVLTPQFLQNKGFTAKLDRHMMDGFQAGAGVRNTTDLFVEPSSGMTVLVGDGECFVRGSTNADQGLYHCYNDANVTLTHDTADPTNPRIDQIIMRIYDSVERAADTQDKAALEIVKGTPTSGATLDNRNGIGTLPASYLLLADVLISASDATIAGGDIRDRRQISYRGTAPTPVGAPQDITMLEPFPGGVVAASANIVHGSHDTRQSAALFYLPVRKTVTALKWKYAQNSGTAIAGNYNIGIYDCSGRQIITTGSKAFAGAVSTFQTRTETITSTSLEVGYYYILIGVDTTTGSCTFNGVDISSATSASVGSPYGQTAYFITSGGITLPTTMGTMTDIGNSSSVAAAPSVPLLGLL
jgi:hypothetical protein